MAEEKKKESGRIRTFALTRTDVTAIGLAFMKFAQNLGEKEKFREAAKRELEELGLSDSADTAIKVVEACIGNILEDFAENLAKSVSDNLSDFIEVLKDLKNRCEDRDHKA